MLFYKLKRNEVEEIQSADYHNLPALLSDYPNGLVGVELDVDGSMMHYLYQLEENAALICRIPLGKLSNQYFCTARYAVLTTNQCFSDLLKLNQPAPQLPKEALFFLAADKERLSINVTKASKPYRFLTQPPLFSDLLLTQKQQELLYGGQLIKGGVSFCEELEKIVSDSISSPQEIVMTLKACISDKVYESAEMTCDMKLTAQVMRETFLSTHALSHFPSTILCSSVIAGPNNVHPTLGVMHDYFVRCIQESVLDTVAEEDLCKGINPHRNVILGTESFSCSDDVQQVEAFEHAQLIRILSTLLYIQGSYISPGYIQFLLVDDLSFFEACETLYEIVDDFTQTINTHSQTTLKTQYESVYRDFFLCNNLTVDTLGKMPSLRATHAALLPLVQVKKLCSWTDIRQIKFTGVGVAEKQTLTFENMVVQVIENHWLNGSLHIYMDQLFGQRDITIDQLQQRQGLIKNIQKSIRNSALNTAISQLIISSMQEKQKLALLLVHISRGEQDQAEEILKYQPNLMLKHGEVIDFSGRKFQAVSGFEYALWAYDIHMLYMMLACIPKTNEGLQMKREVLSQYETVREKGKGVTYTLRGLTIQENHFDMTAILAVFTRYIAFLQTPYTAERRRVWVEVVGGAQLLLPANIAQHICAKTPFDPLPSFKMPIKRTLKVDVLGSVSTKFFWDSTFPVLGKDIAISRGADHCAMALGLSNEAVGEDEVLADQIALRSLFNERASEADALCDNIRLELNPNNNALHFK